MEESKSLDIKRVRFLERLAVIYHNNLLESPEAQAFLEKRLIGTPEIINGFRLGFSKGNIAEMLSENSEELKTLEELGIIRKIKNRFGGESFYEYFKGFIVFPITDDEGRTVEMYARAIDDNAKAKHRALKGEHLGVFNARAFKVYPEMILCKSIIDALSLYRLGFQNVTASFGPDGFTDNHLKLMEESNTRKLFIAYDNDKSGKYFTKQIAEKLKKEGFINIVPVELPEETHDLNDFLLSGRTKEEFEKLLNGEKLSKRVLQKVEPEKPQENSPAQEPEPEQKEETGEQIPGNIFHDAVVKELPSGDFEFIISEGTRPFTYRLKGVKEDFDTSLRLGIRVSCGDDSNFFYDSINLYSARMRAAFANILGARFEVAFETVLSHLETILDRLEKLQEERILVQAGAKDIIELKDDEKTLGLSFLQNPDALEETRADLEALGYIGEDMNKVLVYLIATSRVMEEPLAGVIISRSSAGKSKLVDTVKKLMPEEEVVALSSASDNALYYITDLSHKFVCMGESEGNENIEYPLRELISSKEITRLVTMKDEKTGQMKGVQINTKGPIAYIETTSRIENLNPENLNRCLVLFVDESQEQTRRILEYQRFLQTPKGFLTKQRIPLIIQKHKAAQKLLKGILVINPFAELMCFPERRIEARRDQMKFIHILNAVAFFNQYKREKKTIRDGENGRTFEYIEPVIDNYRTAYELLVKSGILSNTLSDIPKTARDLYGIIKKMVAEISGRNKKAIRDIFFTKKMVWEFSGWSNFQLWKYLNILLEYELIEMVSGGVNGKKNTYRLILEEELERLMLELIPTPEEIESRMPDMIKDHWPLEKR